MIVFYGIAHDVKNDAIGAGDMPVKIKVAAMPIFSDLP
jgi:hypothetical protein